MANYIFVIGPACTGKTTFTYRFTDYAKKQKIKFASLNLDCANLNGKHDYTITEKIEYDKSADGPNNALLASYDKLSDEFFPDENLIIDCPGQIELYLHNKNFLHILKMLEQKHKILFLFLVDGFSYKKYLSSIFLSAIIQSRFLFPYLNVRRGDLVVDKLNEFEQTVHSFIEEMNVVEIDDSIEDIYNEALRIFG